MPHINYSVTEPYTDKQLFDLVNDVAAYPQFIPECVNSGVIKQQGNESYAFIEVEKLGFRKRFVTKNQLNEPSEIIIQLVEGPFNELYGHWRFMPQPNNQCKIMLDLRFEFKSKLMDVAFSPVFREIMVNMVKAFSDRARQVYDA